ncbi:VOC family protein [Mucilaginibacter lappiensis]|uniref:VOC family protein n=1 Tax=Mucilaginibacter lappiensis TaxID=354630 RepID=UPI003D206A21
MQKITTCLWFDGKVEEAINFYTTVFKNSKLKDISYYGEGQHQPAGTVLAATFILEGQEFMILNGGPMFKLTEAVSLSVKCKTQEEIDFYWTTLSSDGGEKSFCGWVKDKYGLSWQIVPAELNDWIQDPKKSANVMQAVMKMGKLDIKTLKEAYEQ